MNEQQSNPVRRLWDWGQHWIKDNATQHVLAPIPARHTDNPQADATALQPYADYFRVWLSEMFLAESIAWGAEWHPAVNAEVKLKFGDRPEVTLSRVAQPPAETGRGVLRNYRLTELMPYNGGVVEIQASLLAMKGEDYLGTAIGVLQSFSSLVTPPVGQALTITEKLASGARDLFQASHGRVHLVFHQTFVAVTKEEPDDPRALRPGYHAVVLAPTGTIVPERLSIQEDHLFYAAKPGAVPTPLLGYDYMLFRIEGRHLRDDWRLQNIEEPLQQAIVALQLGHVEDAAAYRRLALTTAWQSLDLAPLDRRRVVEAIKAELKEFEEAGHGAAGRPVPDLDSVMKARGGTLAHAAALGELLPEEVLTG